MQPSREIQQRVAFCQHVDCESLAAQALFTIRQGRRLRERQEHFAKEHRCTPLLKGFRLNGYVTECDVLAVYFDGLTILSKLSIAVADNPQHMFSTGCQNMPEKMSRIIECFKQANK